MGPVTAAIIALLRNLINMLIHGPSFGGSGDLASFLVSFCFAVPAAFIYKYKKTRKGALLGMVTGAVIMWIVAIFANIYILVPAAGISADTLKGVMTTVLSVFGLQDRMDPYMGYGLFGVLPFNIIRSVLECIVTFLIYKPLSRLLH